MKTISRVSSALTLAVAVCAIFLTACNKMKFESASSDPSVAGNGSVGDGTNGNDGSGANPGSSDGNPGGGSNPGGPGTGNPIHPGGPGAQTCVPGSTMDVYLDANGDGSTAGDTRLGAIIAYSGTLSAAANYNYFSASAHPVVGPVPVDFETHVFMYRDLASGFLYLNFYSNIDDSGSSDNIVDWDLSVSGNNLADSVVLSDDAGEFVQVASSPMGTTSYQARWHYYLNTDGGVLGPIITNNATIRVKVLQTGDIQSASFYSADNPMPFSLKGNQTTVSSFIITPHICP